jgi:hypothetical protein
MKDWPKPPSDRLLDRLRNAAGQTWRNYGGERRRWMNMGNGTDFRPDWVPSLHLARVAAEDAAMNLKRAVWFRGMDREAYDRFMAAWGGREAEVYLKAVSE